ncbi:MAG TPA: amino acid permease [Mycobacteriales bacterium]|nr:amino acid permease [Mycobacteriales bacterium]
MATSTPVDAEVAREHPRVLGITETVALAMGGSNQSLFIIGALFLAQGSAAVPLLIFGLLLAWAALPGWTELVCMWPNRVGGIAATCAEAFRPYSPVLANLTGVSYWWGWIPTCGLTAILASEALHSWYLPMVPVHLIASLIVAGFALLNLRGIKYATRAATLIGAASATLALASTVIPVAFGTVDWQRAGSWHLETPFHGAFGALTSTMAGLYLIGFAAPAFEAAACHVGEMRNPTKALPRAMFGAAGMATLYFLVIPIVWFGAIGGKPLEGNLTSALGPIFAPAVGVAGKSFAVWFMVSNMLHGTLQPVAGAARTLSQLADDGLLPRSLSKRNKHDAPYVATLLTAGMAIAFLLSDDPPSVIAAANFTYLIGICLPSVAVWLLRRNEPHLERPWRAPRGTIGLGLIAAGVWGISTIFGFEQYGLSYVLLGLAFAYSGSFAFAWRRRSDRRLAGLPRQHRLSLHAKLSGAMIGVIALDGAGYLLAVNHVPPTESDLVTALQDIFVAVALLTVSVGLVLPGIISHLVTEVGDAARSLARHTLPDLTRAMVALGEGRLDEAQTAESPTRPVRVRTKDELGTMAVHFNAMQERILVARDALDRTRDQLATTQAQLVHLADHDPLTGLLNRRRLQLEVAESINTARTTGVQHALVLIDLDNFKMINDTRGHALGDTVLRSVAVSLQERLRPGDTLARLGGDEFAVILPACDQSQAADIARDLISVVALTTIVPDASGRMIRVNASAGVAAFSGCPNLTPETLLVDADLALYEAKATGRNRVAIADGDQTSRERMQTRQSWVERIRTALDNDGFELWAQPILDLSTREITRHELLLRLGDGDAGIPPSQFLAVAEQVGLIADIDTWVIAAAFQLIRAHLAAGLDCNLQVNVSGASVADPAIYQLVRRELAAGDVPGRCVTFEITETSAIADMPQAQRFARMVRDHDCGLSLDDFGAGFGSFFYLKHLPFDSLKIDGEFIRQIADSAHDQYVVRALVQIASALHLETVAEFVEEDRTLEILEEIGVTYAQGYAIGRPQPASNLLPPASNLPPPAAILPPPAAILPTQRASVTDGASAGLTPK